MQLSNCYLEHRLDQIKLEIEKKKSVTDLKSDSTLLRRLSELTFSVFHELFIFQDIIYSSLFDFLSDKVRRDIKKSNSRKKIENWDRKTYQVQENCSYQTQVTTFSVKSIERVRQQKRRAIENRFSKELSTIWWIQLYFSCY